MAQINVDKEIAKQMDLHQTYLTYAMDDFVNALIIIKKSITNSIIADLRRDKVKVTREMEQQIKNLVEQKLSIIAQIKFEE